MYIYIKPTIIRCVIALLTLEVNSLIPHLDKWMHWYTIGHLPPPVPQIVPWELPTAHCQIIVECNSKCTADPVVPIAQIRDMKNDCAAISGPTTAFSITPRLLVACQPIRGSTIEWFLSHVCVYIYIRVYIYIETYIHSKLLCKFIGPVGIISAAKGVLVSQRVFWSVDTPGVSCTVQRATHHGICQTSPCWEYRNSPPDFWLVSKARYKQMLTHDEISSIMVSSKNFSTERKKNPPSQRNKSVTQPHIVLQHSIREKSPFPLEKDK